MSRDGGSEEECKRDQQYQNWRQQPSTNRLCFSNHIASYDQRANRSAVKGHLMLSCILCHLLIALVLGHEGGLLLLGVCRGSSLAGGQGM